MLVDLVGGGEVDWTVARPPGPSSDRAGPDPRQRGADRRHRRLADVGPRLPSGRPDHRIAGRVASGPEGDAATRGIDHDRDRRKRFARRAGDNGRPVFRIEDGAVTGTDERGIGGAPLDRAARVGADGVECSVRPVREADDDPGSPAGSGAGAVNGTVNATAPRELTSETLATAIPDDARASAGGVDPLATGDGRDEDGDRVRSSSPRIRIGSAIDETATATTARSPVWRRRRRSADCGVSRETERRPRPREGAVVGSRNQRGTNKPPLPAIASVNQPTAYGRSGPR